MPGPPDQPTKSTPAQKVIAICLVLLVIAAIAAGGILWHRHHAAAQRDKYRDEAQFWCTLAGNVDPSITTMSPEAYLHSKPFKQCTEDRIDALISEHSN